jgi:dipeptide/tripeptide permease
MMQSVNTVFLLVLIPLFQSVIYPGITRLYRSPTPLQVNFMFSLSCTEWMWFSP